MAEDSIRARPVDRGAHCANQRGQLLPDSQEDQANSQGDSHSHRGLVPAATRREPVQSHAHVAVHDLHIRQRDDASALRARAGASSDVGRRGLRRICVGHQHAALRLVRPHLLRLLALRRQVPLAHTRLSVHALIQSVSSPAIVELLNPDFESCEYVFFIFVVINSPSMCQCLYFVLSFSLCCCK